MPKYNVDITHIITPGEAEDMIKLAKKLRDKALIAILYLTGARPGEICLNKKVNEGLKKGDIQISGNYVIFKIKTLKLGKHGKNKGKFLIDERELEIPKEVPFMNYILRWRHRALNSFMFPISTTRAWQIVHDLSGERFTPYNFRHSSMTKLRKAGASKDELQEIKGARDVRSVEPYLHAKRVGRKLKFE
jgi:integrase